MSTKPTILIVTPHLSTGGLPQYLLWRVQNLIQTYRVVLVEWTKASDEYTVQRDKLEALLGADFISLDDRKDNLLKCIERYYPSIVHFEEVPEYFCSMEIAEKIYVSPRPYKITECTHSYNRLKPAAMAVNTVRPDGFLFVCKYSEKMYSDFGIPTKVYEYPVVARDRPDRSAALSNLEIDPVRAHILNVGLFTPGKNQDYIFELAQLLPGADFHFIGNQAPNFADFWKPLMAWKPNNCYVWGECRDVDDWYAACDLFLFPSKAELAPIVVKEAMGWGMKILMRKLPHYGNEYDRPDTKWLTGDLEKDCDLIRSMIDMPLNDPTYNPFPFEINLTTPASTPCACAECAPKSEPQFTYHFCDGPCLQVNANSPKGDYRVKFIDTRTGICDYETILHPGEFALGNRKYYVSWRIEVDGDSGSKAYGLKTVFRHDLDLTGKDVSIEFESSSLGDTIAWIPCVDEFQRQHKCNVAVMTYFNSLFEGAYPNLKFVPPASEWNAYARYRIGSYTLGDRKLSPRDYNAIPLQQTAALILGLTCRTAHTDAKLSVNPVHPTIDGMFVCIGPKAKGKVGTDGCPPKLWNYPGGWDTLGKWLKKQGYTVVNCSDMDLQTAINHLEYCEFFVGLTSGLSWLANAMGKRVFMISGFTNRWNEFPTAINIRPPTGTCTGCYHRFPKSAWDRCDNCPENLNWECTRLITPEHVIEVIEDWTSGIDRRYPAPEIPWNQGDYVEKRTK